MNQLPDISKNLRLDALLAAQRAAYLRAGPPSYAQRIADLDRLKQALLARRGAFEASVSADFGRRAAQETALMELVPTVQGIDYLRRHLKRWMRPHRRHVALHALPGRARVLYQPLGVVGIVSPWNFPLALSLMPLATALAAGNRVMLKPSELTPRTSDLMASLLSELFPEDQVATITGGSDIGAAFSALPFDYLFFTGSTAVGRHVMRAAADNLVPVTLELGGKSPAIIEPGFPLDRAAASIAYGKLANAGQICVAPDYALIHEGDVDAFVAAYAKAAQQLYPGGSADPAYASIINDRHMNRLAALLEDARRKGARIIDIGPPAAAANERIMPPRLILDATPDMTIMQEEIFGPLLPVVAYKAADEAIAAINAGPRPLALYVFSDHRPFIDKILTQTTSGNVTINDTLLHYAIDDLPFGGIGASGMGAYHGEEGFRTFSHAKGVFAQARWNFARLVRPPFGRMTNVILSYLLR